VDNNNNNNINNSSSSSSIRSSSSSIVVIVFYIAPYSALIALKRLAFKTQLKHIMSSYSFHFINSNSTSNLSIAS